MLYVTSRNDKDSFTAQRAIAESRGPDGGIYVPFRITPLSEEELGELANISFNQCLALILNRLLHTRLTGWDMDLCIGRYPVRLSSMSHRIVIGESWHNPDGDFRAMVRDISRLVRSDKGNADDYGPWMEMSVRIAVSFGIFAELMRQGMVSPGNPMDVSVVSGDFFAPMSIWYARMMGLPAANIVCCCNENSGIWNLIHHGELRTDQPCIHTATPEADVSVPDGLECLISACCGTEETDLYLETVRRGRMYCPAPHHLDKLRQGIQVSVISGPGMMRTIPNVFSTSRTLLSPYAALAYAGLLDYRARTGESRYGLILAEKSPATDPATVSEALNISPKELRELLNQI